MLAYAANNRPAGRAGSPKALVLIVAGHAALLAAVMSAKMEVFVTSPPDPIDLIKVRTDPPPPPVDPQPLPRDPVNPSTLDRFPPVIPLSPAIPDVLVATGPITVDPGPIVGPEPVPVTLPFDPPVRQPVFRGPRIATSDAMLKPPYPAGKQRDGEEATLRLRLSIDARGRVVAVDPVGAADPAFLEAARRHIIRSWRYRPATEDGTGVASTTVITLSFRLEDA